MVADGQVYLFAKVKDKFEEQLTAYDAGTGKVLWQTAYPRSEFKSPYGNGPRATPAVVGGKLYAYGITGILTCLDAANGSQVWQVDTLEEFKVAQPCSSVPPARRSWTATASCSTSAARAPAWSPSTRTGATCVWKSLDDRASYSSPIVFGKGTERQVVFLTQPGLVALGA